ncbi:MAG: glutaredoxin domain-containing protein [Thiogranum sp.]
MARVKIYSTGRCPMCDKAKKLLGKWRIPFQEVRVDQDRSGLVEMSRLTRGARTVPQIAIDGKWIGSLVELTELHMDDKLDALMVAESG